MNEKEGEKRRKITGGRGEEKKKEKMTSTAGGKIKG